MPLDGGRGLIYFKPSWEEGLKETGGLFHLENTILSVLQKELEYKVEKLTYKTLEVMQPRIKTSSWWINHPGSVYSLPFVSEEYLGEGIGELNRVGGINFLPLKRGAYLRWTA